MYKENETITTLKSAMGYVAKTECCSSCKHFHARTDGMMIGGPMSDPKPDRCSLNVIDIPVNPGGRCKFFKEMNL